MSGRRLSVTLCLGMVWLAACRSGQPPASSPATSTRYDDLQQLFTEWREFQAPRLTNGVPDYTATAMAAQHRAFAAFQRRLAAIDPSGWSVPQQVDYHLVRAEMNGLDFDLRVLQPWARDPSYYIVVHTSQSDTPAHEGSAVQGAIELWTSTFPVSGERLDAFRRTMKAAPALLEQAKKNLTGNAKDLWTAGIQSATNQSAALKALATRLSSEQPELVGDVTAAEQAMEGFRAWLEAELPKKTGPSGVGIEHYNWYLKNVHLLPYTWQDQVAMVRRELARAHAALRLEEHRNRALPPHVPVASAAEHRKRFGDAVTEYMDFFRTQEVLTVEPWMDQALRERVGSFRAGPREFFSEVDYRDPLVMRTHSFHWIDLARMAKAPHSNHIRRGPLLYNIWAERSEGLATSMEEMMMHAGMFDTHPRTRELIHILLAQRGARAMGDLMMHANEWSLDQAATFAVEWTPRGWLRKDGTTVWGEQQLYLQQPAYGTSYLIGKIQIEQLMAERAKQLGDRFSLKQFMDDLQAVGLIPVALIRWEMTGSHEEIVSLSSGS